MKKYYYFIIIFGLIILILNKIGLFDRLHLTNNKILIKNNVQNTRLTKPLKIIIPSFPKTYDTLILFENNNIHHQNTEDWYGKDYIKILYKDKEFIHSFNNYKLQSWHKITYKLNISLTESKYIILEWKLYTKWYKNFGIDTVLLI